jgi:uncharacterized protein YndB with AHSA1/START domain
MSGKSDFGKVSKANDGFKVVFEREYNHAIDVVWEAITDPDKLRIWFTDVKMKLEPGSEMNIIFRDEAKTVTTGRVIEVKRPHRFVWTWETELAVWELTKISESKTKLVFTYSKMDDRWAVGAAGGFHTMLTRLEKMLGGSNETYPFGTEEFDPEQIALREQYGETIYPTWPELQKHNPIKLVKTYEAPVQKVWEALTNKDVMKQWYFDIPDFKPVVGVEFKWYAGPPDGKQWLHAGKVTEVIPLRKLAHTWTFPGYEGEALTVWELTSINSSSTRVDFKFEIITPFDPKQDELARKNFVSGWNSIINEELVKFLKK